MGFLKEIYRKITIFKNSKFKNNSKEELHRLSKLPRHVVGYTNILHKPFKFHDAPSFVATYKELFEDELYKFDPKIISGGIIIDCGANMGLSVLYFALNYPNHKILAFEPDESIFMVLKENVKTFNLRNVTLYQKAVWVNKEILTFQSDGGMGGRINNLNKNSTQRSHKVETVVLNEFLNNNVDFLKIDIEGAEVEVLLHCKENLKHVKHIFFEYHNNIYKPQSLHHLLAMMHEKGFIYHIKESSSRRRPFVDRKLLGKTFDMAITVFCTNLRNET